MRHLKALGALAALAAARLLADNNPPPSQPANSVSPPYVGAGLNAPFPDNVYGADHGGSGVSLAYPFTSPFGFTDHSRGVITYVCAPFTPRNSEGVYGLDVWLEQQDSSGNWSPASLRGGVPDQGATYQPVNTPNPGPSPSYAFTWTFNETPLPPNTAFRVFVYVYLYNQGGGSQGNFYVASSVGTVNSGAANDAPRLAWTESFGPTNPSQVSAGQTYTISADAQDDNGNLIAVSINRNGQPFAYAGGGNGFSGNSQNPTSDSAGTVTYTAWADDSDGAESPTLSWTVTVVAAPPPPTGPSNQPPVGSNNAALTFGQTFLPEFYGGAGTGGWQFAVGGYTNWNSGASANTGTWLPDGSWAPTWLPPQVGSYPFWVVRDGDANDNPSSAAGPYTLTVSPASASFSAAPLFFTYNGSPQGPTVSPSPANAPFQTTGTATATGAGTYVLNVAATGNYAGSASITWFINSASQTPVLISPANASITAGQSITFEATGGSSTSDYTWSGAASGTGPSNTVTFPTAGNYLVTVARPGDLNYLSSNTAVASIVVDAPSSPPAASPPPTASLSANPAAGTAPLNTTITWSSAQASSASVTGSGMASTALSGTQAVTLSTPGTYTYVLTAEGLGGQVTQSATVAVTAPQVNYTLTTVAIGNGSATAGGTYPANAVLSVTATPGASAVFTGWTGGLVSSANPLAVIMTGNLTLFANFSGMQTQTISFAPPTTIPFPGPAVALSATASSGLPVSLTVLSGPGFLSGGQLTLTGTGTLVVQANQGGNAQWLPAPPVSAVINAPVSAAIARIRFNATGHDARVASPRSSFGTSILWTESPGLLVSPWPTFANPQTLTPATGNVSLPAVPAAPSHAH